MESQVEHTRFVYLYSYTSVLLMPYMNYQIPTAHEMRPKDKDRSRGFIVKQPKS